MREIELMLNPMIMLGDEDHTQTLVSEWIAFSCISKKKKSTCEPQGILQEEAEIVPPSPTAPDDVLMY